MRAGVKLTRSLLSAGARLCTRRGQSLLHPTLCLQLTFAQSVSQLMVAYVFILYCSITLIEILWGKAFSSNCEGTHFKRFVLQQYEKECEMNNRATR